MWIVANNRIIRCAVAARAKLFRTVVAGPSIPCCAAASTSPFIMSAASSPGLPPWVKITARK
eukprot:2368854-Lingulodinium_polyedra.AAC.1